MMSGEFFEFKSLKKYAENECILLRKNERHQLTFLYREVIAKSLIVCELLSGVSRRNVFAIKCSHSPATCVFILSILNKGCSFCLISAEADKKKTKNSLTRFNASFLISNSPNSEQDFEFLNNVKVFEETFYIYKIRKDAVKEAEVEICYSVQTSGSTGTSKIVHVPFQCIKPNVSSLSNIFCISESDVILCSTPVTFDPFIIELFLALRNGAALLVTTKEILLTPSRLIKVLFPIKYRHATIFQMTPSRFRFFGSSNIKKYILHRSSSLRILVLGGEPFPSINELKNWIMPNTVQTISTRIFNIYGITEISCWSTLKEVDNLDQEVSLGHPLDDSIIIKVVDHKGKEGLGEGELHLGSSIRKCLIDDELLTPKSCEIKFRNTGDLVLRKEDGILIHRGRTIELIKRYGHRINLRQISSKIQSLCGLSNNVHYIYDESRNLFLLFIASIGNVIHKSQFRKTLQNILESSEKPDQICFVKNFPLTQHGKISRKKLIRVHQKNMKQIISARKMLTYFLRNTLGLDLSSGKDVLNTSFTDAGGTSFQAVRLCMEIERIVGKHQRKLTGMLLDSSKPLKSVLRYIEKCEKRLNLKPASMKLPKAAAVKRLNLLWEVDMGKCVDASPSLQDEYVCIGSHSCLLLTLHADSGEIVSSIELPDRIEGKVQFLSREFAAVGCYDGYLYVFDFKKGKIEWRIDCEGMIKSKPLLFENHIVVGSYSNQKNIKCISVSEKNIKWTLQVGTKGIFASPILLDGVSCLICSLDGSSMRVQLKDGCPIWIIKADSPIFSTPFLINKFEFVVAEVSGIIRIANVSDGSEILRYHAKGNVFSNLEAVAISQQASLILFGCHDHTVRCLKYSRSEKTISSLWCLQQDSAIFSTPKVISSNEGEQWVLVCSSKGLLTICNLNDGNIILSHDLKAEIFSSPCFYNRSKFFVGCRDNFVYCFELKLKFNDR